MALDETTTQLLQMRTYHQRQLERIDDALALLKDAGRIASKATALTGRAQALATETAPSRRYQAVSAKAFMQQHGDLESKSPSIEARRVNGLAAAQGLHFADKAMVSALFAARKEARSGMTVHEMRLAKTGKVRRPVGRPKKQAAPALSKGQRQRLRTMSGDTVTNRVRRVLQAHGSGALTRADIQEQAKVSELVEARHAAASTAKALEAMARNKEVKQTKDGWMAYKLQPPTPPAGNGAHVQP